MKEISAGPGTESTRYCRLCDIVAGLPQDVTEYADRLYELLNEKDRAGEDLIRFHP